MSDGFRNATAGGRYLVRRARDGGVLLSQRQHIPATPGRYNNTRVELSTVVGKRYYTPSLIDDRAFVPGLHVLCINR